MKVKKMARFAIGDRVKVQQGADAILRAKGWHADYMTSCIDGMVGEVRVDHRDVVGTPHIAVDLGFEHLVGLPELWVEAAK